MKRSLSAIQRDGKRFAQAEDIASAIGQRWSLPWMESSKRTSSKRISTLLKTETNPMKRAMEMRLLAEEEAKLTQTSNAGKKEAIGS